MSRLERNRQRKTGRRELAGIRWEGEGGLVARFSFWGWNTEFLFSFKKHNLQIEDGHSAVYGLEMCSSCVHP